ncbi:hypothetical protein [Burkholderia thailandensis]|uniref:hypothetical protein n=1 Tax=Burkholderia thailandensis TaxID=57975 RepID=UPI0003EC8374|nr:hypothetical protein [Burkholderia thailandensis]AHI63880.1 hypothetical protein BTL_3221 [Burkholderia thailandensis H0587]AOJ51988.1 hypothetical protein AQ475_14940 [Burkholderia thailandensis]AVR24335.1 hypothetical protein A8H32_03640 [Burkholderia thailandensis]
MKKTRAPDLTEERIREVIDILDGWTGKLTWDALLDAVEMAIGIRYSRFTFADYPEIANAFSFKKDALRGKKPGVRSEPRDERVRAALEQAQRYKDKAKRLEQENQLLLEQFVTWATNAERKGVTMAMLNAPLPKPRRDRTGGDE